MKKLIITISLLSLFFWNSCIIDDECLPHDILKKFEEERNKSSQDDPWGDNDNYLPDNNGNDNQEVDESLCVDESLFVDLGLPSGTKWCICNIGAESIEEYGSYLTWSDAKTQIPHGMSLPTWEQGLELVNSCKWRWDMKGGVLGYSGQGPNRSEIFLPAGGIIYKYSVSESGSEYITGEGDVGYFWMDYDNTTEYSFQPTAGVIIFMNSAGVEPKMNGAAQASKVNVRCVKK